MKQENTTNEIKFPKRKTLLKKYTANKNENNNEHKVEIIQSETIYARNEKRLPKMLR